MGKTYLKGTSTHLCVLIFPQGIWRAKEKESLRRIIPDGDFDFLRRLTSDHCTICSQIDELFDEIQSQNEGLFYLCHNIYDFFYIFEPEYRDEVIRFVEFILEDERVKKIYILQVGSFKKVPILTSGKIDLEGHLTAEKHGKNEFLNLLEEDQFQNNTLYEVAKEKYY